MILTLGRLDLKGEIGPLPFPLVLLGDVLLLLPEAASDTAEDNSEYKSLMFAICTGGRVVRVDAGLGPVPATPAAAGAEDPAAGAFRPSEPDPAVVAAVPKAADPPCSPPDWARFESCEPSGFCVVLRPIPGAIGLATAAEDVAPAVPAAGNVPAVAMPDPMPLGGGMLAGL